MLDFDGIVLSTLQGVFSRTIVINPIVSQSGGSPYAGRGVFSTNPVDVIPIPDVALSDQRTTVWVRISEWPIMPLIGDKVEIPAELNYPSEGDFEIQDISRHADGKAVITLKRLRQEQP
jgi:hypothetical protein